MRYSKISFAIVFVFLLSAFAKAQTKQLIYDFSKGEFVDNNQSSFDKNKGRVKPVFYGGFVRMKIININTFRYKVELSGNTVNFVTPVPSELQKVFRLSSDNVNDQNIAKALGLANAAANTMQEKAGEINKLLPLTAAAAENAATKARTAQSNFTIADSKAKRSKKKVDITNADSANLKAQRAEDEANFKKAADDAGKKLQDAMEALVEACNDYIELAKKVSDIKFTRMNLISLSTQPWKTYKELEDVLPDPLSEDQMKKDYESFTTYYATANSLYQKAALAAKNAAHAGVQDVADFEDIINGAKEQIDQSHDLFLQDNFIKLIEDVTVLQNALANPEYFEVKSAPIQVNGDYVDFNVNITPAPVNALLPFEISRTFPVEIPAKSGLKVDFSVGPAISFGSGSKDEVYYLEALPDNPDQVILKKRSNNNKISPGIAAMMHAGPRSGTEMRIAGMFGVGAGFQNTTDVNLSLYGGLSGVFGKMERVMLSAGVSYLKVDRLKKDEFTIDKQYTVSDINLPDVTEKVFKPSFFIGFSYNLTNRLDVK